MEPELRLSAAEALEHPWLNASWKQGISLGCLGCLGMLQRKLPMASCQAINIMKKGYTGQVEDFLFWHVGCDCIFIMYI